jgi:hypothetical protein
VLGLEPRRRKAHREEDGARSGPSRARRVTGKAEEGAGNDHGPAAINALVMRGKAKAESPRQDLNHETS